MKQREILEGLRARPRRSDLTSTVGNRTARVVTPDDLPETVTRAARHSGREDYATRLQRERDAQREEEQRRAMEAEEDSIAIMAEQPAQSGRRGRQGRARGALAED